MDIQNPVLRRYEDTLNVCGLGVIILSAWDILKIVMEILTETREFVSELFEKYEELGRGAVTAGIVVGYAIVFVGLVLVFLVHLYIGRNASRAAKRQPYKKGYYVWTIILLIFAVIGLFSYTRSFRDTENIDTTIVSLIVELTNIYILGNVVVYTRKIRAFDRAQTQE